MSRARLRAKILAGVFTMAAVTAAGALSIHQAVKADVPPSEPNPFFGEWTTPFGAPPFDLIREEHFIPAYDAALAAAETDVAAIAANPEAPTFANTIVALEKSGQALARVSDVFFNLTSSDATDGIQAIQREMAPRLARFRARVNLDPALFARVDAVWQARDASGLSAEDLRVLERFHRDFVRAGAALDEASRNRLAAITERLSVIGTTFSQNLLADTKEFILVLESEDDLAGLPAFVRESAAAEAASRGMAGKWVITLQRPSIDPFLTFSARRDLREKAFAAWTARGDNGNAYDNNALIAEIMSLRIEMAKLLGFETFADFVLDDRMAKTPATAIDLLTKVWEPALAAAMRERDDLQAEVAAEGGNFAIEPWDWRYYQEKVRHARFDLDQSEVKPYFQLDKLVEAQFFVANQLFGISFTERTDIPVYHPDVRVWEVTDASGRTIGLFYGDCFARPTKGSGAWMSSFTDQERINGDVLPLIINNCNYNKGAPGEAVLLSLDDARTLFHEFGHALHGLLSNVTHPRLSGTSVSRDFVEFPSQIYEHWLMEDEILKRFAVHVDTGEAIPDALIAKIRAARNLGQGFATVEFVASAIVDMDFHQLTTAEGLDVDAFEKASLARIGMPREITMRHRTPHFSHVWGGGYAAGYYSYLWSEILDADGFDAFLEAGNIFDPEMAARLYKFVYSAGNTRDPAEAYRLFRGRDPEITPLLRQRGLIAD